MANRTVFSSASKNNNNSTPTKMYNLTVNGAGGVAFRREDEEALAQFAVTGMFGNTFYADATSQLEKVRELATKVKPEFLAKVAVYSREQAFLKDMPAFLLSVLLVRDPNLFKVVFPRVMSNGRMLRNFCQVIRSGTVGRKSFGHMPKRLISEWLNKRTDRELFNDAIGNEPSLMDVLKMVHPKPATKEREALFAYLLDSAKSKSDEVQANLPQIVKDFEAFKSSPPGCREIPAGVSFERLTAQNLNDGDWENIAKTMSWTQLRMNLNTLERHGVFKKPEMVEFVVSRLKDEKLVAKANVFPYQLFSAYKNVSETMPQELKEALDVATSLAIKNIPNLKMDNVLIAVDCSGSMNSPISVSSNGVHSKMSCNDVASLMASCLLSACGNVKIARFDGAAEEVVLSPQDSVLTNAKKLNRSGGSTDCSAPLRLWNQKGYKADLVIYLSDNESWGQNNPSARHGTGMNQEWKRFLGKNPNAKLVCLDVTPNTTVQVNTDKNVLNVGGFSDSVFTAISSFLEANTNFVQTIENSVTL